MINKIDHSHILINRAYALWEQSDKDEPWIITKQKIVSKLFIETKQKSFWMRWLYCMIEQLFPRWMEIKVSKALSAYKYDLIVSGNYRSRIQIFSPKERWFIDQKLVGVFKNIIEKTEPISLSSKANRWNSKIKKYYKKREFMLGSYILFQIGRKFPNFKNSINWVKALNLPYLEKHCVKTFKNVKDEAIVIGISRYLNKPFDEKKGLFQIFAEISYQVTKEKAKITAQSLYQRGLEKAVSTYRSFRELLPKIVR